MSDFSGASFGVGIETAPTSRPDTFAGGAVAGFGCPDEYAPTSVRGIDFACCALNDTPTEVGPEACGAWSGGNGWSEDCAGPFVIHGGCDLDASSFGDAEGPLNESFLAWSSLPSASARS